MTSAGAVAASARRRERRWRSGWTLVSSSASLPTKPPQPAVQAEGLVPAPRRTRRAATRGRADGEARFGLLPFEPRQGSRGSKAALHEPCAPGDLRGRLAEPPV